MRAYASQIHEINTNTLICQRSISPSAIYMRRSTGVYVCAFPFASISSICFFCFRLFPTRDLSNPWPLCSHSFSIRRQKQQQQQQHSAYHDSRCILIFIIAPKLAYTHSFIYVYTISDLRCNLLDWLCLLMLSIQQ